MRFAPALVALPALAAAQGQAPLLDQAKALYMQAYDVVSSYMPKAPSPPTGVFNAIPNPIDAGAAEVAGLVVDRLTLANHKTLFQPGAAISSPGLEEWMIFVTGGNKTCFGLCQHAENEWNKSVPQLAYAENAPHLAMLDCETDPVLCNAWAMGPPSVIHAFLPQPLPDQSTPQTIMRSINLNRTSVTAQEIAAIHTEETYKQTPVYEGFWHPFDGPLAKVGLNVPVGYAIWGFSLIPSWMFMIGISFISRSMMSGRGQRPAGGAPAAAN